MKYKGSKIALGIFLILLSFFTVENIGFSNAEQVGYSMVPLVLIMVGIYQIFKGIKSGSREDLENL